jgi:hypothetical protein
LKLVAYSVAKGFFHAMLSEKYEGNIYATLKIEPIHLTSVGGFDVQITGLEPTDHDCLVGQLLPPRHPSLRARWNLGGVMRGGTQDCNLDMRSNEMIELVQLARNLGAR